VIDRTFTSELAAPVAEVWSVVSTMAGVNAELGPWLRMTHPAGIGSLEAELVAPGEVLFHSWLLVGGVLPFDRHALGLERVLPGEGFDEESTSWVQRRWRHERRVAATARGGSTVTDHLVVAPRVALLRPVVDRLVSAVFRHRHRQLVRRFGPA
jgi:hypothetical protein